MRHRFDDPLDGLQVQVELSPAELSVTPARPWLSPAEPVRVELLEVELLEVELLEVELPGVKPVRAELFSALVRAWLSQARLTLAPVQQLVTELFCVSLRRLRSQQSSASAQRVAVVLVALLVLIGGAIMATMSTFVTARGAGGTVGSAPLIQVGLVTASTAYPQVYSVTGVGAGGTADRLVNLQNDGTASVPLIKYLVTTSSATALDTDSALGLTVSLDRCSVMWDQASAGAAASCSGTQSVLSAASPLATLNGAAASTLPAVLSAASSGGIDHLRVRFALPGGAPGGYTALTSTPTVKIYGQAIVPGAPTSPALVAGDTQLTASWTAPASTGGAAITAYTATASPGSATCTSATSPCTLTGPTNGVQYSVTVVAANTIGTSAASTAVAATPFPAALTGTGAVLWLDASDSTTLFQDSAATTPVTAAGQNVVRWNDKSGASNNVTASGAGSAPVADTSTFGRTSLTFSSGRYLTRATGFPTASDYTILAAYRPTSAGCFNNILSGAAGGAGAHAFYTGSGAGLRIWHAASGATTSAGAAAGSAYVGSVTYVESSRATTVDVNGSATSDAVIANAVSDAGMQVGALAGVSGFCGQIPEVAVFSRVLTSTERRSVQEYLGQKWSITLAPFAPTGATAVAGSNQATVSWTAPASTGGSAITGYTVTASPGGVTCTTTSTSCVLTGLANNSYTFSVAATNVAGTGPPATATAAMPKPGAPTGISVTEGNTQLTVYWTAPAYSGTSAISGYTVSTSPGGATCSTASPPCTVTGLTNGTDYTVTVTATNGAGAGDVSIGAVVTPYPTAVMAPGLLVRWFDASDGTSLRNGAGTVTTTGGTSIGTWIDKSSAGVNAVQGTAANRFTVGALGGRAAALSTAAGATFMNGASGTFGTVIAVANPSRVTNWGTIFSSPAGTDTSLRTILGSIPNGQNGIPASNSNDWSKGDLTQQWTNSAIAAGPTSSGGGSIFAASPPSPVTGTFSISTSISFSGVTRAMDGPIGEVLVFNRILTRAEQRQVEEYLGRRWSVLIAPDQPASASASAASTTSASVTWTAPAYNGGASVTGYTVTSSPGAKTCTGAGTTCTVTGLTTGVSYTFTVTATNSVGIGPAATTSAVVP